jgi:hypothetical protein
MIETYLLTSHPTLRLAAGFAAAAHDVLVGPLIKTGFVSTRRPAPRGLRTRHTSRLSTFTTAMRVITRRHGSTAHGRADAHVAFTASFAQFDITVIQVANLTNGRVTGLADQAYFSRRQADLGIFAFFGQYLRLTAGRTNQLGALAFL